MIKVVSDDCGYCELIVMTVTIVSIVIIVMIVVTVEIVVLEITLKTVFDSSSILIVKILKREECRENKDKRAVRKEE